MKNDVNYKRKELPNTGLMCILVRRLRRGTLLAKRLIRRTRPGTLSIATSSMAAISLTHTHQYILSLSTSLLSLHRSPRFSHRRVITLDNFTTPEECQTLIDLGHKAGYERSKDVGRNQKFDGSFDAVQSTGRTSENAWCSERAECRQDPVVQNVMNRMGKILDIPPENSEDLQLLKYEVSQFYNSHHDYIGHQRDRQCGPRILTVFMYLNDEGLRGGGTRFTDLDITVQPKVGRALIWPSVYDSDPMNKDPRMMHEAMAVEEGTKFGANGWIHMYDYLGPQARGCN
jgi:prolyl 4-hydroxylase